MKLFGVPDVYTAIKKGDIKAVDRILANHPELANHHEREDSHIYPLSTSIHTDNSDMVRLLVKHGATRESSHSDPLVEAVACRHWNAAEALLDLGMGDLRLALMTAIRGDDLNEPRLPAVKFVVEHGGDVNAHLEFGNRSWCGIKMKKSTLTPLQYALCWAETDVVRFLLEKGSLVEEKCSYEFGAHTYYMGWSLGEHAQSSTVSTYAFVAAYGDREACELILSPLPDQVIRGLAHYAAICNNYAALAYLIGRESEIPDPADSEGRPYYAPFMTYLLIRLREKQGKMSEQMKQIVDRLLK